MKRILKINPLFGFGLVLLITLALSLYGLKTLRDRDAADDWVTRTNAVITTADQVMMGMINMETGFRGYMLTGSDDFLQPYRSGKTQYETAIQKLLDVTDDNSAQEVRWREIQTISNQWETNWAAKVIQIRRDVNAGKLPDTAVLAFMNSREGKTKMDSVRQIIEEGKQEEMNLLTQRKADERAANTRAYEVMLVGMIFAVILGLATGVLLARSSATSTEYIQLQHLLLAEREKERMEIARDLHDGPLQDLLSTTYTVQSLTEGIQEQENLAQIQSVRDMLQKVIGDLRAYARELRSPVLAQFGLEKAIQSHLELFQPKHPELRMNFEAQQSGPPLPAESRDPLFRIYQEAINNIVRHSQATEVNILFRKQNGQALLELRDNGVGFEPPDDWLALARQGHLGLVGIRERADAIGGRTEIRSHPGKGTCLRVIVPVATEPAAAKPAATKPANEEQGPARDAKQRQPKSKQGKAP